MSVLSSAPQFLFTHSRRLIVGGAIGSALLLGACSQEADTSDEDAAATAPVVDTAPTADSDASNMADDVSPTLDDDAATDDDPTNTVSENDIELSQLENNIGNDGITPSAEATVPSAQDALTGEQITEVQYASDTGEPLTVIYKTSRDGVLTATVSAPNQGSTTLDAPQGQGNNPTYESQDGTVKLVSHEGGSNIDIITDGDMMSYQATDAQAEVITQE